MKVFLAGATGVIGRRLVPMLIAEGHQVVGMTRSRQRADALAAQGVEPVVADAFDSAAVRRAVTTAYPHVVMHQLTDLPAALEPQGMTEALARNARLRIETTPHFVAAARAAGAHRLIAQSLAFAYAPGPAPLKETDPLDLAAQGDRATSVRGVVALEKAVLDASDLEGVILRYGRLYGPGTWYAAAHGKGSLHVDAAAQAALLALTRGSAGTYNIAEDDGAVAIEKARRELNFDPEFRAAA
jgi:nucleoside-diphosphate-sugar epimerase